MNKPYSLILLALLALTITYYGLPYYKQRMTKYKIEQRLKEIKKIVELYYVDEKSDSIKK